MYLSYYYNLKARQLGKLMSLLQITKKICFSITEIARFQNYSVRVLTREHLDKGIEILTEEFDKKQPLSIAYYKKYPQKKRDSLSNWKEYWTNFCPIFFQNGLSVGCFDLDNKQQLVGTLLGKNLKFQIDYFKKIQKDHFKYPNKFLGIQLFNSISPQFKTQIIDNKQISILQTSSASIKDAHMGKGLLFKMMLCSEYLGFLKKYQYVLTWTSNVKSAKAVQKLDYQQISEVNAKIFLMQGIKYFEKIDQDNKLQTLWIKEIGLKKQFYLF